MTLERIALVSDVHGNVTAFEAVLDDIEARDISVVLNLGDVVGKGPRGSRCVELSRERCAVTVRGNWDDFLPMEEKVTQDEALRWWHRELLPDDREWLRDLPFSHDLVLSGRRIRLFHASAENVYRRVHAWHGDDEFAAMFAATRRTGDGPEPVVVAYGDIHYTYLKSVGERTLLNVGSVGNPLDQPTAAYAILEGVPGGTPRDPFGIQFVRVSYDVEAEIAVAAFLDMPEFEAYAVELRTGVYRGFHAERGLALTAR